MIVKPAIRLIGRTRGHSHPGAGEVVIENPGDKEKGVLLVRMDGFRLSGLVTEDDGEYGLFPVLFRNGVIERSGASVHSDAGNTAGFPVVLLSQLSVRASSDIVLTGKGDDPPDLGLGLPGVDLLWDGSGADDGSSGNTFDTSFPPVLPACG